MRGSKTAVEFVEVTVEAGAGVQESLGGWLESKSGSPRERSIVGRVGVMTTGINWVAGAGTKFRLIV